MKYSEFREYLKLNEIPLKEEEESLVANDHIKISKTEVCRIVFLVGDIKYPYEFEMIKKAIELAETPLDEREEEKKYYLKHRFINNDSTKNYINFVTAELVILSDRREDQYLKDQYFTDQYFKTKFTKAEIEELKEKFDTDLNDFELIEVEG